MQTQITDEELREAVRTQARVVGLELNEERIDILLPTFKSYLASIQTCKAFALQIEDEPSMIYLSKPSGSEGGGR